MSRDVTSPQRPVRAWPSAPAHPARLIRQPHVADRVVFVDGIPACGKTMMAPIVTALDRVEMLQYSYPVEYQCILRYLGKIDEATASTMLRMLTDLHLYNIVQSRETNFRYHDLSGIWSAPQPLRYFKRLFQEGDQAALERIHRERPILHLVTHFVLTVGTPLFHALGDRLRIVEVVRHPLYMLKQQFMYMPRFGTDVRDFTIWFDYEGLTVPWFSLGWERKFADACPMDKAIYMIEETGRLVAEVRESLTPAQRAQVMFVPFERYVIDPWPFMERLEAFVGTRVTATTRRVMKKQRVPRTMYAEGINLDIYRLNGWEPPRPGSDEAVEFARRREFAASHATPEAMAVLDRLCAEYEQRYMSGQDTNYVW